MSATDARHLATHLTNLVGRLEHLRETLAEYPDGHANVDSACRGVTAVLAELPRPTELHWLDGRVVILERILSPGHSQAAAYAALRARCEAQGVGGLRLLARFDEASLNAWARQLWGEAPVPAHHNPTLVGGPVTVPGAPGLELLPPRLYASASPWETDPAALGLRAALRAARLCARDEALQQATLAEARAVSAELAALPLATLRWLLQAPALLPAAGQPAARRAAAILLLWGGEPAERARLAAVALLLRGLGPVARSAAALSPPLLALGAADPLINTLLVVQHELQGPPHAQRHPWSAVLRAVDAWAAPGPPGEDPDARAWRLRAAVGAEGEPTLAALAALLTEPEPA
jgi:hypothetical protein